MNRKNLNDKHVLLGLSGGVDSTAAALLLREKGFSVTGLFFDAVPETPASRQAVSRAEKAAGELGIPFLYRNVRDDFDRIVIGDFCQKYREGKTPNPCIICNPLIKFRVLAEEADRIGAARIATGHYARVLKDPETGLYGLWRARNRQKDQSYMLYRLDREILSRLLLPLDETEDKEAARQLLRENSLSNAEEKDSQEICFLPEGVHYADFITRREGDPPLPGAFTDQAGTVLGTHEGILHYTVGQRKGLGIALGKPAYVISVDHNNNTVTLGPREALFRKTVISGDHRFFLPEGAALSDLDGTEAEIKIRYGAPPAGGILRVTGEDRIETVFYEPQRAPAPGQSVVFYLGDRVLGGGFIERSV